MAKKLLALLLALVMVLSIAACTPADQPDTKPNAGNDTTPKDTEPKDTEEEHEPVTISILTHNDPGTILGLEAFNKLFMEKYPWITVEIEAVASDQIGAVETARFAAKDADIIRGGSYAADNSMFTYVPDGLLNKSTSVVRYEEGLYLDLSDIPELENWGAAAKARCSYDGKWISVPTATNLMNGLFYNKTMFDKYNLEVPTTWAEFMNVCKTLKDNGENVLIAGMLDNWPPQMLINDIAEAVIVDTYEGATGTDKLLNWGKAMWEGDAAFTDEMSMKIWNMIDEVNQYWCEAAYNCNLSAATAEFVSGNCAMYVDGSNAVTSMADVDFEWGYFAVPGEKEPEGEMTTFSGRGQNQWSICSGTKYPEECKLWIALFSTPEGYGTFINTTGTIPYAMEGLEVENAFAKSVAPGLEGFYDMFSSMRKAPAGTGEYANYVAAVTGLKSCLGTMTVEELAEAAHADWELAMEQNGVR